VSVFKLEILTPRGSFFKGEVEYINFINSIGKIEILPGHISYLSEVLPSVLDIKQDGIIKKAAITEGIVDFKDNVAVIMAEAAEWPGDIDLDRAQKAYDRAEERVKSKDKAIDKKRAEIALMRSIARLKCGKSKCSD
jgi:F-type H+-transporting ATPase subunit epsilon